MRPLPANLYPQAGAAGILLRAPERRRRNAAHHLRALDRILHFFPEDYREQLLMDLSFNLRATIAQQLIPSIDGSRRWAGFEVMMATPLVKDMIRKGEIDGLKNVMKDGSHHGMVTFDQCMFKMYKDGKISYDEALRHADSRRCGGKTLRGTRREDHRECR